MGITTPLRLGNRSRHVINAHLQLINLPLVTGPVRIYGLERAAQLNLALNLKKESINYGIFIVRIVFVYYFVVVL